MLKRLRSQQGIGLLELMLSLAIIAILLIMATRYYNVAYQSEKVNEGAAQINNLVGALANWKADQPNYSNLVSSTSSDAITTLSDRGLVTSQTASKTNPWGTSISLTVDTSGNFVTFEQTIPKTACLSLADKFASYSATCDSSSGKFSMKIQ
ncbi:MAG: prepilin-type N-terminal cleavage/methylation domain-containing protein [Coxiellaceae bacterium]|nr:MAG: prepilin-type N-terminal cleavage/methylation domain-containing protein [Coxiellaceae bacterium]